MQPSVFFKLGLCPFLTFYDGCAVLNWQAHEQMTPRRKSKQVVLATFESVSI
jgi:hypothetical protein